MNHKSIIRGLVEEMDQFKVNGPAYRAAKKLLSEDERVDAGKIYDLYPKKVGKPAAIKAIQKAVDKFGYDHVYARTARFSEVAGGQFVPHPSTFFNQERFNDDPKTWPTDKENLKEKLDNHVCNPDSDNYWVAVKREPPTQAEKDEYEYLKKSLK